MEEPKLLSLEEAQKEMNEKLLQGWVMLDTLCPISHYPLVFNRKTGETWSIRCQCPVLDPAKARASGVIDRRAESSFQDVLRKENKQRNDAGIDPDLESKRLAEKLLAGWKMLDEDCPVSGRCPLMLDPKTGRKWSASLNDYIPEEPSHETQVTSAPSSASTLPSANQSQTGSTTDLTSKRLGEKLLLGWTMLEEECPVTRSCPLMLDPKTGKKWSASLNDYIPESLDEAKKGEASSQTTKQLEDEFDWSDSESASRSKIKSYDPLDWRNKIQETVRSDIAELENQKTETRKNNRPSPPRNENLVLTRQVLQSKLEEARTSLSQVNLSMDTDPRHLTAAREMIQIIGACAQALQNL